MHILFYVATLCAHVFVVLCQSFRFDTRTKRPVSLGTTGVYIQDSVSSAVVRVELDPVILAPYQAVEGVFFLISARKCMVLYSVLMPLHLYATLSVFSVSSVNILHCLTTPVFQNSPLVWKILLATEIIPLGGKKPIALHSPVELLCNKCLTLLSLLP